MNKLILLKIFIPFIVSSTDAFPQRLARADDMSQRYKSTIDWRHKEDVIFGWDWSLPPWVKPTENSAMAYSHAPDGFTFAGNRLFVVSTSWRELEPIEGSYRFDLLQKKIDQQLEKDPNARVMLFIYGSLWKQHFKDSQSRSGNVPDWLAEYPWFSTHLENWQNVIPLFQLENADIYEPEFNKRYMKFLRLLGKSSVLNHPKIGPVMIKGKSGSMGEEHGEPRQDSEDFPVWLERLDAWIDMMGDDVHKLVTGTTNEPWASIMTERGIGTRSGFAEMYLLRMENQVLGQYIDDKGFLCVDESVPMIAEERYNGDDNEEYIEGRHEMRFGPVEYWPHRHHESSLRILQMRRNFLIRYHVATNPNMASYVALELGRNVGNTPDIWCYLRKSYLGSSSKATPKATRHYERWLYNRDAPGYTPMYSERIDLPKEKSGKPWSRNRHPDHYYDYTARKTDLASGNPAISFDIDDRWLSKGTEPLQFKITFTDRGNGTIQLQYVDSSGKLQSRSIKCANTGSIRTATFNVSDLDPNNRLTINSHKMDFRIQAVGEDVTVNFVRVIKSSPGDS